MRSVTAADTIRRFFSDRRKYVISFAGFGELGYEDPSIVERVAHEVLGRADPERVVVNAGTLLRAGGQDGIARIHALAKACGFETSGIHPSVALGFAETHYPSPYCDHVFYVEDAGWGGFVEGTRELSPTLGITIDVSDELVVIGGGKHAADELEAFVRTGKVVRYFPAEMNREATREWCDRSGARIADFRGDAHAVWLRIGECDGRLSVE